MEIRECEYQSMRRALGILAGVRRDFAIKKKLFAAKVRQIARSGLIGKPLYLHTKFEYMEGSNHYRVLCKMSPEEEQIGAIWKDNTSHKYIFYPSDEFYFSYHLRDVADFLDQLDKEGDHEK